MLKIFLSLFLVNMSYAQYAPEIRTGRPGQSIGPFGVGKDIIQLQSGYTYEDIDGAAKSNLNNVIRFGVTETIEVRSVIDQSELRSEGENFRGTEQFRLGVRKQIYDKPDQLIQTIGLQLGNAFGMDNDFDDDNDNQVFVGVVSFLDQFTFNYVANFEEWQDLASERFILNYADKLTAKLSWFIEPYFDQADSEVRSNINYGFGYLIHNNLAVDISAGNDLDTREYSFISIGFSVRNR